jgi:hypothetical protein
MRVFPPSKTIGWIILGDSLNEETEAMIIASIRDLDCLQFIKTGIKSNAGSFNLILDRALELDGDEILYFIEDDYLHTCDGPRLIEEGLVYLNADYVSLYDHPDKYRPASEGGNPFIDESAGDLTKVFRGRTDADILRKWTSQTHPMDFNIFLDLWAKGRVLMTPLPGASTHGDTAHLSPYRNWKAEV